MIWLWLLIPYLGFGVFSLPAFAMAFAHYDIWMNKHWMLGIIGILSWIFAYPIWIVWVLWKERR